ncbi:MAG: eukaryotic-like serine/threonine-protein kinase [Myxococcales bacterium]|nr:eukaryotic-like serine/threonine-protein kinase [Myxococcales bacterium]
MSSNATSAPEAGQTLAGKYLVEEVLGVGGMGIVVAARHLQLDQKVAIKYLLPAALLNPEVVERFAREARAAAKIRGEHVARVIDVGQFDDGAPYMVMEHLEGHDLAKHLELHGPLPIEDSIRFLLETCEALAEAHSAKIVHRDLKPSNMFLSTQPDKSAIIKVLDFGISKTGDAPSASLTKTSALMGTAFYMSPEQLTNPKGVDHRSDIWSLGVILYELLAGRQPFLGESVPEIIGAILTNSPDGVRTLRPDVPVALEEVIGKCLQSKAADRYQSVAGLAAALGPFAHVRDRISVDIIARVLGEAAPVAAAPPKNPNLAKATVLGGQIAQPQQTTPTMESANAARVSPAASTSAPPPSLQSASEKQEAPAVAAVTTHALATSAITTAPKRTPMPLIAGAAILVVAVAVFGGMKLSASSKSEAPPVAATGLVPAAPVDPHPTGTSITTILPAVTAATNPAADPAPATPSATAAAATNATTPRGNTPPRTAVPAPPAPAKSGAPVANAAPPASAAPAAPASAAPAAVPVSAPSSSTKSNPLQMGIK